MSVGLVLVSHSAKIAEGLTEILAEVSGNVTVIGAGGRDDGGIGTSFTLVSAALSAADSGDGVLVLADLGSAVLTAETALELLDPDVAARCIVSPAPLVEGAVAAAVAAQLGDDLAAVAAAALTAGGGVAAPAPVPATDAVYTRRVTIINRDGLHARPAAEFAQLAARFEAATLVNGKDTRSLLLVMSLGLLPGMEAEISTTEEQGRDAVDALADLVESGFGETTD